MAIADAPLAAKLLHKAMVEAFVRTFPGAPTRDLVITKIGSSWAAAKEGTGATGSPLQVS